MLGVGGVRGRGAVGGRLGDLFGGVGGGGEAAANVAHHAWLHGGDSVSAGTWSGRFLWNHQCSSVLRN